MKITALRTRFVAPRWCFLTVHTDEGIVGYGEPVVEGRARTVATAVSELGDMLIGQDPRRIEHLWQVMYRGTFYRGGPVLVSAISGVEQALWDILGKSLGVPVYQLLGGAVRDRIRLYAHVGGADPAEIGRRASEAVAEGYTAVKMSAPAPMRLVDTPAMVERVIEEVATARTAVGNAIDIAIDFHGRVSPAMAVRLCRELEPYRPLFVEEPCLPENVDALVTVARSTTIPIATGERLFTRWGFREVLEKQAAAVLQPDLCHAGGILECRKIAAMAETYYAAVAPHNPLGPISLAACVQLDACTPNFLVQEQISLGQGYLRDPFVSEGGYIALPTKPGLGIELDEDALAALDHDGSWHTPILAHADDGSFAEW